ncbi:hypothetical protein NDU88_003058 [Pleurodeles waltl]|uniref:Uncharacterized protein n=1 Tax=Pleurodeles waltl TaxID=8319 RepID=A0AAV7T5E8_PLEWA|nr:hypothetical protein NDU88_003058 [Pleurodeles waltl]
MFKTVIGSIGECPGGTSENAPCLCHHVHQEEEETCGTATEEKEDAARSESEDQDGKATRSKSQRRAAQRRRPQKTARTREPREVAIPRFWTRHPAETRSSGEKIEGEGEKKRDQEKSSKEWGKELKENKLKTNSREPLRVGHSK